MRTEPTTIDKRRLVRLLSSEYGLGIASLTFWPKGEDSYSYIALTKNGTKHFVRIQKTTATSSYEASIKATALLHEKTWNSQVVAPYRNRRGKVLLRLSNSAVVVFPYINGKTLYESRPSTNDVAKAARLIAAIHSVDDLHSFRQLDTERFEDPHRTEVLRVLRAVEKLSTSANKYQRRLRRLVRAERTSITWMQGEMRRLRTRIRRLHYEPVLTHGDANLANFIKDDRGRLFLTDWGELGIGPAERDIFHFSGRSFAEFLTHYKRVRKAIRLQRDTFEFYWYRWALQEIADYSTRILFGNMNPTEDHHSWEELKEYLPLPRRETLRWLNRIDEVLRQMN